MLKCRQVTGDGVGDDKVTSSHEIFYMCAVTCASEKGIGSRKRTFVVKEINLVMGDEYIKKNKNEVEGDRSIIKSDRRPLDAGLGGVGYT